MLLRQVDRCLGFTKQLDGILPDQRNPLLIQHSQESLLRQRIYGLALGYEGLNDHDSLRHDLLWQTATDRTEELGSCSTLCRLENRAGRKEAWLIHQVLHLCMTGRQTALGIAGWQFDLWLHRNLRKTRRFFTDTLLPVLCPHNQTGSSH